MHRLLITGGAGFIGSNFVHYWLGRHPQDRVVNLDLLTYAGNLENLKDVEHAPNYRFVHGDIGDQALVETLLAEERVDSVVNFAAESHVDRSILGPAAFIATNINGTFALLEAARNVWGEGGAGQRFLHVSTDEVYGSLAPDAAPFTEGNRYAPNSPYSASKAASDHLVRAYGRTYGLPVLITNCSNNYGPYQFPEKLIPLMIANALAGKPLPVYGDGQNVRDWLYVGDHCAAVRSVLERGRIGECYNIGGEAEMKNIDLVKTLCALLDQLRPRGSGGYAELITFVRDRPGHDRRYAMDATKLQSELGWRPAESFESGLRKTVTWYLDNAGWVANVTSGAYREWMERNYAAR